LVQEEKEVMWRMQRESERKGTGQMERRVEEMKYQSETA
jgi:hypothetical protein